MMMVIKITGDSSDFQLSNISNGTTGLLCKATYCDRLG